jgi:hypothetical protein
MARIYGGQDNNVLSPKHNAMTNSLLALPDYTAAAPKAVTVRPSAAKTLFLALRDEPRRVHAAARQFIDDALAATRKGACDLPADPAGLEAWCDVHTDKVGQAYRHYLDERKAGGTRQYFATQAAALHFLRAAAPTKLVDGSWLFGMLEHWRDAAYHGLIRTYLEELGDGVEDKNHVLLYQNLLTRHGCDQWDDLSDEHFVQGALQLALAAHGNTYLPELVGYNLGYEQLPLHLLITSYELNELGIDPYYFTLHVTVDNASNGHARRAIDAVRQLMARADDPAAFYRRVIDGYRLNDIGASTGSIIESFDLDAELQRILVAKGAIGKHLHSDYCKIAGRGVSDWLADPADMPGFIAAMQDTGWLKRGQEVSESRFWGLVSGPRAQMFGVFSAYELQVLRDWIEHPPEGAPPRRVMSHRARQRNLEGAASVRDVAHNAPRGLIRHHAVAANDSALQCNALRRFEQQLGDAPGKEEMMAMLIEQLAPDLHHTPAGLMATRMFNRLIAS